MINAVSSIPSTTSSTASTSSASSSSASSGSSSSSSLTGSINMGKEDFLKLLTTQLQYQDPLAPEDPKDFVAQLAQFSSVEQLINANTKLDNFTSALTSLQSGQQLSQGVSLLGKTIKAQGNSFAVTSGQADTVSYILGGNAKSVKVGIYNSSGTLVRTLDLGSQSTGENKISWDAKDANGKQVADGTYTFQVTATDATGKAVDSAYMLTGKVEEVLQSSNKVYLKVNGRLIAVDNVVAVEPS